MARYIGFSLLDDPPNEIMMVRVSVVKMPMLVAGLLNDSVLDYCTMHGAPNNDVATRGSISVSSGRNPSVVEMLMTDNTLAWVRPADKNWE